jgi:hypothetical protein
VDLSRRGAGEPTGVAEARPTDHGVVTDLPLVAEAGLVKSAAAWLFVVGWAIFWVGAFTPPWRQ